jgi:signal recognition particle subunit SRP54
MFDKFGSNISMTLRRLVGKGKLNEQDIKNMMKEIRLSLLEADVNYKVVKAFTSSVEQKALGSHILKGLNPGEQVFKIVKDELIKLLGGSYSELHLNSLTQQTNILLLGLQGSGKTTTIGKLTKHILKQEGYQPLLVGLDVYRPAAMEQLKTIADALGVPVYLEKDNQNVVEIARNALSYAKSNQYNVVLFDTAGRLQIDQSLMDELVNVQALIKPDETLLVLDAMTGQVAVDVAHGFHSQITCSGAILTKLDGDTRGGAALSMKYITDLPIKFAGVGEKMTELEPFYPDRIASRILGMGDMETLVDKVSEEVTEADMMNMMEKMMSGEYNYEDYLKQLKMMKRMGSLKGIMKLIPGLSQQLGNTEIDDKQLVYIEAMINSMTRIERKNPSLIEESSSRRRRISEGSGRSQSEVRKLISTMEQQKVMMNRMAPMMDKMAENPNQPIDPMSLLTPKQPAKKKSKNKKKRFRF